MNPEHSTTANFKEHHQREHHASPKKLQRPAPPTESGHRVAAHSAPERVPPETRIPISTRHYPERPPGPDQRSSSLNAASRALYPIRHETPP